MCTSYIQLFDNKQRDRLSVRAVGEGEKLLPPRKSWEIGSVSRVAASILVITLSF